MVEGKRGRPRSEEARRAVLDAALELCEREGYQHVTIKGIADLAGVGRQTVYRWWPTKDDVLLEAVRESAHRELDRLPLDSGDTLRDVRTLLEKTFAMNRGVTGRAVVGLLAQAQADPELSDRLQSTVIGPRREFLHGLLDRGAQRGELTAGLPLDLAVDFAFGTMWYRLLSRHAPVDDDLAAQITEGLRRMLAPGRREPER